HSLYHLLPWKHDALPIYYILVLLPSFSLDLLRPFRNLLHHELDSQYEKTLQSLQLDYFVSRNLSRKEIHYRLGSIQFFLEWSIVNQINLQTSLRDRKSTR